MTSEWVSDDSAQNEMLRAELVQVARFGARGDVERVRIQVMRLIRTLRSSGDELADKLQAAVFTEIGSSPTPPSNGVRRSQPKGISEPVPTDTESRLDLLRVEDPPVLPHDVVQNERVLQRLDRLVLERSSQARLAKLGLEAPKSVLFTGPPGVGKTMAARHVALKMKLPLLVLDLASVMSSLLGKSGSNIKQVFKFARERPCVFFVDEIDAVAKRRDDDGDVGEVKRLVTVLLQEIDMWASSNLMIAATNHPQLLDPAIQRRFDGVINFPKPTYDELVRLAGSIPMKNDPLPKEWVNVVAQLDANTSHSNFVRDLSRIRRAYALGGKKSGVNALTELAHDAIASMDKAERKKLGVSLIEHVGISQRDASAIAGVARETLRTAMKPEAENG